MRRSRATTGRRIGIAIALGLCVAGTNAARADTDGSGQGASHAHVAHVALVEEIEALLAAGHPRLALEASERALAEAETSGDPLRIGVAHTLRGRALALTGELERAGEALARAAPLLAGSPALAGANALEEANLAARRGALGEAAQRYAKLALLARERGDAALEARAKTNAWRARVEADPADLSRRDYRSAVRVIESLDAPMLRAALALHLARSLELARAGPRVGASMAPSPAHARPWLLAAHRLLAAALADADLARSTALRGEALGQMGSLYEAEGRVDEAMSLTDRALAQMRASVGQGGRVGGGETGSPLQARWQIQAGRLRRRLGELDAALAHYAEAVAIVGRPRDAAGQAEASTASSAGGARRSGLSAFESEDAAAYRGLVDLLLQRAARQTDAAARTADLRDAQSVLESYRVAELRDYFADDCVDRGRASRARVDEAAGDFVVVYPVILEDRIELLVSRRDWIERRSAAIGRIELEKLARQYRGLLEDRTTRQYLRPAQALHAVLIEPIADLLAERKPETLVLVPDGILRTIPFAALHDGERHLIERFALATTPSLELTDPHPFDRSEVGSLYGGLTVSVQGFAALPQVKAEIAAANRLLPGVVLLDESFSKEALVGELSSRSFELVHVASHAEFSSEERGGFLLTHDGKLRLGEFRRAVELLQFRERPLELLVLSACETAAGDERAALGFSGAAVQAGARSVLGSLWLVQDDATSALLASFYEGLAREGLSRAQAMQRAQRRLIDDPAFTHPSAWAAFLLINSWL